MFGRQAGSEVRRRPDAVVRSSPSRIRSIAAASMMPVAGQLVRSKCTS
jgi:hypothetical protein